MIPGEEPAGAADANAIRWDDPSANSMRAEMLRFARINLRDDAAAEDMVQEAFLAAMQNQSEFAGRSALKTWIFSILRHKIIDHIRKTAREINRSELSSDGDGDSEHLDALFNRRILWSRSHWSPEERPATWSDPDAALSQKQFWAIFDACVNHLPDKLARVFMMREFLDLDTAEICAQLGISSSNCWVILHRARTGLRACLENNWFKGDSGTC